MNRQLPNTEAETQLKNWDRFYALHKDYVESCKAMEKRMVQADERAERLEKENLELMQIITSHPLRETFDIG